MTEQVNPTPQAVEEAPKKKRVWLIILIIVAVLLLCCVAIGVITMLTVGPEVWDQVQATLTAMPAY